MLVPMHTSSSLQESLQRPLLRQVVLGLCTYLRSGWWIGALGCMERSMMARIVQCLWPPIGSKARMAPLLSRQPSNVSCPLDTGHMTSFRARFAPSRKTRRTSHSLPSPLPLHPRHFPPNIAIVHTSPPRTSLPALSLAKNKALVRKPSLYPQPLALHYPPSAHLHTAALHRARSRGSIRGKNRTNLHAPAYARCAYTSTHRQPSTRGLAFRKGEAKGALDVCDTQQQRKRATPVPWGVGTRIRRSPEREAAARAQSPGREGGDRTRQC